MALRKGSGSFDFVNQLAAPSSGHHLPLRVNCNIVNGAATAQFALSEVGPAVLVHCESAELLIASMLEAGRLSTQHTSATYIPAMF